MGRHKDLSSRIMREQGTIRSWLRRIRHPVMNGSRGKPEWSDPAPGDEMDQTQRELLKEQEARTYTRLASRAEALDRALESLQRETYGICQKCGAKIPRRRLKAVPGAVFCVTCQEGLERVAQKGRKR